MHEPISLIDAPAEGDHYAFRAVVESPSPLITPLRSENDLIAPLLLRQGSTALDSVIITGHAEMEEMFPNSTQSETDAVARIDKTDKTDSVRNEVFLQKIIGNNPDPLPMIVSFSGNPKNAEARAWQATRLQPGRVLSSQDNNYFALATFHQSEDGKHRRRKKDFAALHAIMLDDVGSKVDAGRVSLSPSWAIETSSGNYQLGYILAEPLTDGSLADHLMNAVIAADLCDPGANGPQSRLARLPVGINGKYDPPFPCRLAEWAPDRRYTVEQIINGMRLDMQSAGKKGKAAKAKNACGDSSAAEALFTLPSDNPVIAALRAKGLYKSLLAEGKHDITCPWAAEHSGGIDGGAAYFEPSDATPLGGFKCLHSHGDKIRIRALLDFLGVPMSAARMKPIIRIIPGELDQIVDAAERSLTLTGQYFQRGGMIVTVVTDPGTKETCVQTISQPALLRALSKAAVWERVNGNSGGWIPCDPPAKHTNVLFDGSCYPHLPALNGLARQPYLRLDGSLCCHPGYDAQTGMYGAFSAQDFAIPDIPTREQALGSFTVIAELLSEFSFAQESDRSAALCAILTATIRSNLPTAPMFHVRAPQISAGKSYLCELITAFATAQAGTPTTFPVEDEECRKLLLAELLQAPAVIEFDNLNCDLLAHKSLCTALTSGRMTGRILGLSKTATVNTQVLLLSSGNNVGPVADMTRRCVTINLDPRCETPATRTFSRPDLVGEVRNNRGRYVSAALTIMRAYIANKSAQTNCKTIASFNQWTDWCRKPLIWLGLPDPATSVFEGMDIDPDRETLGRLLLVLVKLFGKHPIMVRDLKRKVLMASPETDDLRDLLEEIAGERDGINSRRLGRWIKRHAGRIVHDLKLVRAPINQNAESWRVESVISVSSIDST
ncbi:MAG TPA: hypothetical protein VGU61_10145 [Noviherbaspirillum sp.]|jgi:hypothetical protein|uniref:hypothetical protein n=1 Tax=Noviherbaspirillum sp. TaxID=1926288 RepID=UPI002DDCCE94|nr:hypothetical protein [Noviherbaspirillum sp.]HEV2610615.1 hypothetical protein [Noviherbaspirillum sp.]